MIRPFTCICLLLAAASGLYLYQTKHRTLVLDQRIGAVLKQADEARAATVLLRAQYAQLSRPDRLMALSQRLLTLRPTVPDQFVQLAGLDSHLPPVAVFPKPGEAPPIAPEIASPDQIVAAAAAATLPGDAAPAGPAIAPLSSEPVRQLASTPPPATPPPATPHVSRVAAHVVLHPAVTLTVVRPPASPAHAETRYAAYTQADRPPAALIRAAVPALRPMPVSTAPARSMLGGSSSLDLAAPVPVAN